MHSSQMRHQLCSATLLRREQFPLRSDIYFFLVEEGKGSDASEKTFCVAVTL